jgi:hypothetical protein
MPSVYCSGAGHEPTSLPSPLFSRKLAITDNRLSLLSR